MEPVVPRDARFWDLRLAVVIPCFNEAVAIGRVVEDFTRCLPGARIHVFDNNSSDGTSEVARSAGAEVHRVALQGKGNVVRRMFADVEADIFILVDGDATYDAESAPALVLKLLAEQLDMVVGSRVHTAAEAYRRGHQFGNRLFTSALRWMFGGEFADILSGYRVFSRRFAKSFPAASRGFEIESELTIHALELRMPCGELPTPYGARPEGGESKLQTYSDGVRILATILRMLATERPLRFYGALAAALALAGGVLIAPIIRTYLVTGLVPRFPTAILVTGLGIVSVLSLVCGIVLENVTIGRREGRHLRYLQIPAPQAPREERCGGVLITPGRKPANPQSVRNPVPAEGGSPAPSPSPPELKPTPQTPGS
jgi:hypothetical protein